MARTVGYYLAVAAFLCAFSMPTFAQNTDTYIIPEACFDRAVEVNFLNQFDNTKESITPLLKKDFTYGRSFNMEVLIDNYSQNLSKIKEVLDLSRPGVHPELQWLFECEDDTEKCFGHFTFDNPHHREFYCDAIMLDVAITDAYDHRTKLAQKCGPAKEYFFNHPYQEDPAYLRQCTEFKDGDRVDKQLRLEKEVQYLESLMQKYIFERVPFVNAVKESDSGYAFGLMYFFIMQQMSAGDPQTFHQEQLQAHNRKIFAKTLSSCGGNCNFYDHKSNVAAKKLQSEGNQLMDLWQSNRNLGARLKEYDLEYYTLLRNKVLRQVQETKLPVEIPTAAKIEYFRRTQNILEETVNPLGWDKIYEDSLQDDVRLASETTDEYAYQIIRTLPQEMQDEFYDARTSNALKRKMHYQDVIARDNPLEIEALFRKDPMFQNHYMMYLGNTKAHEQFELMKSKEDYYLPRIFEGYLPHHIFNTMQAYMVREIQKRPKDQVERSILNTYEAFVAYFESLVPPRIHHLLGTTLNKPWFQGRLQDLYQEMRKSYTQEGSLPVMIHRGNVPRRYIYGQTVLDELNAKIENINGYCYDASMSLNDYENITDEDMEKTDAVLVQKIQEFYDNPILHPIVSNPKFLDYTLFRFKKRVRRCLTDGTLFGPNNYKDWVQDEMEGARYGAVTTFDDPAVPPASKYHRPVFALTIKDLHDIEDNIEELYEEAFDHIEEWEEIRTLDEKRDHLMEAILLHPRSIIDYGIQSQSPMVASMICHLLYLSDDDAKSRAELIETINTVVMAATIAVPIFVPLFIPMSAAALSGFFQAVSVGWAVLGTGYAAFSIYEISESAQLKGDYAISVLQNQYLPHQVMSIRDQLIDHIHSQTVALALSVIFSAPGLKVIGNRSIRWFKHMTDRQRMAVVEGRKYKIQSFLKQNQDNPLILNDKHLLQDPRVVRHFINPDKIDDATKFNEFLSFAKNNNGDQWLKEHLPNLYKQLNLESTLTSARLGRWLRPRVGNALGSGAEYTYRGIEWTAAHINRWKMLTMKRSQGVGRFFKIDGWWKEQILKLNESIVNFERQTGKKVMDASLKNYLETLKLSYQRLPGGHWLKKQQRNESLEEFLDKYRVNGKPITDDMISMVDDATKKTLQQKKDFHDYMVRLFQDDLLNQEQIDLFFRVFNRRINISNLEDAKAIKNILKFSKMLSRHPLKRVTKDANSVYTDRVLQYSNELFDLYKLRRYEQYIDFHKRLKDLKTTFKGDITLEDMYQAIKKTKSDYFVGGAESGRSGHFQTFVNNNKESIESILNSESTTLRNISTNYDEFLVSNQKFFRDQFEEQIKAALNSTKHNTSIKKFQYAYKRTLRRTRMHKTIQMDCRLPNSQTRIMANKMTKRFTTWVTFGSISASYAGVHWDEEKDLEWFTRGLWDIVYGTAIEKLRVAHFTRKNNGWLSAMYEDGKFRTFSGIFDSIGYGVLDTTIWGHDASLWPNDNTEKMLYELILTNPDFMGQLDKIREDSPQTWEQIQNNMARIDQTFQEIYEAHGESQDEIYYQEFVRRGLIEDIDQHPEFKDDVLEAFVDVLEQEALEERDDHVKFFGFVPIQEDVLAAIPPLSLNYGTMTLLDQYDWFMDTPQSSSFESGFNRYMFYRAHDITFKLPSNYVRTNAVYQILCKNQFIPAAYRNMLAVGAFAVMKGISDPLAYYMREKTTGN